MHQITQIEMLAGFQLRLRFADGAEGTADPAPLVGQEGVYAAISAAADRAAIGPRGRSVEWRDADGEAIDLCADALRLEIQAQRAVAE